MLQFFFYYKHVLYEDTCKTCTTNQIASKRSKKRKIDDKKTRRKITRTQR
jgi:hypothetical protein